MRILLTGASGMLGAHFLRHGLSHTQDGFVCPVTFSHRGVPERIVWAMSKTPPFRQGGNLEIVRHDCATPVNAMTAAKFGDIDLIMNFASDTHPPRSVTHPVEFVHNNVDIALYLLEYARTRKKMPTFVQISTNSVYGPALADSSHPEWDAIIPNNPYGASKVAQEALAISYWRSYNLPVILINLMNPIGETQDTEKFIPNTIGKVLRGETVEIHADANGDFGKRTYSDAPEVVQGIRHILDLGPAALRDSGVDRPDRWHIAGRQEIDNHAVAQIIADELMLGDWNEKVVSVDRPEHGHRYSLSAEKLAQAGWQPSESIEPAIRRIARWTTKNPLWLI